ncbi:MAG: serine/threonine protein kinase, partial [Magnetococcales bacterium]|nr:serine/threonine protein kinase [Magnetococcales bacterium]
MKKGLVLAGRYALQKELGKGIFGDSYLAIDEGSGLSVMVKIFLDRIGNDDRIWTEVRRHFQLLRDLDHPHIVKVHALERDALTRDYFLVSEHVDGVTLDVYRQSFAGGKVPWSTALSICRQIALALDHAHRSLLHRALNLENVLISPSGEIKLTGFCLIPEPLAREIRAENMREPQEAMDQTYGYLAPEQFFGFPATGPAADRHALAAICYELVSGRPAFAGSHPQALMHAICNSAPPVVPELGKRRNRLLQQAMAKDPGQRFSSSLAFVEAMEASPLDWVASVYPMGLALLVVAVFVGLGWHFKVNGKGAEVAELPVVNRVVSPGGVAAVEDGGKNGNQGSQMAVLQVGTRPEGAEVVLDGKRLGTTPLTVGKLVKGRYALKLEKAGYNNVAVDIELVEDMALDFSLDAVLPVASKPVSAVTDQRSPSVVEGKAEGTTSASVVAGGAETNKEVLQPKADQEKRAEPGLAMAKAKESVTTGGKEAIP